MTAQQIIDALHLVPLKIEGGYYRETWRSDDVVPATAFRTWAPRFDRDKVAGSAIYYLLTDDPDSFSAWHRLPTDEVYHFYLGDPVEQWRLDQRGAVERVVLGSSILDGHQVQSVAPRGVWHGSRLCAGGRVALMGTTMAPGFDARDYEPGDPAALLEAFPQVRDVIRALTRVTPSADAWWR